MKTIQLISHVGKDGILNLQLPNDMKNQDLEILVVVNPIKETNKFEIRESF